MINVISSLDINELSKIFPYSIVIRQDGTIVSLGAAYKVPKYVKYDKLLQILDYFNLDEIEYRGAILPDCKYFLWDKTADILVKGTFYYHEKTELFFFIGQHNNNRYPDTSLNVLLYCRRIEKKIFKYYNNKLDFKRYVKDLIAFSMDNDVETSYAITYSNYYGKVISCNNVFLDLLDRSFEDVVGNRPRDKMYSNKSIYIDPDYVDRMVAKGRPFYFENIGCSASGRQFWFGATVFPLFDNDGENIGRVHFIKDISDRKIVEVYPGNEAMLSWGIQAARIGLWSIDLQTLDIIVNDEFREMLRLSKNTNIIYKDIYKLIDREGHLIDLIENYYERLSETSNSFSISNVALTVNGIEKIFNLNTVCVKFSDAGKPLRLVGTLAEITNEKLNERRLTKQKEFYETLLDEIPADIAIFTRNFTYSFVNRNAIRNPLTRKWIINKDDFDYCKLRNINVKIAENRKNNFENAIATRHEVRFVESADNSEKYILRIYYPILDSSDNVDYVIGYGINISEQILAVKKEKEFNEHKNQFIRITSHELRTPLTIIYSNAEMLQLLLENHTHSYVGELKYIQSILNEVNGIIDILNELMLVSRIEKNGIEINIADTDLKSFFTEIIPSFSPYKDGRILDIVIEDGVNNWPMDVRLMKYAVINLLVNAFKYSLGKRSPSLNVSFLNDNLKIQISDYGIGIPAGEIDKIFSSFYRCSNVAKIQGTGIGLMIVKYAIDKHHGDIQLESKLGYGCCFTITIPRKI